ncbi:14632_t:CDS:1 [Entrophospora sp. SA101]|nr:15161_t:CDS:1 [Entrophospora sp. SA101]CAJ0635281.1 15274_t:CDS:1 [Entrophospora sp. SA101]CAJ0635288.1 15279_t:CDS:1 [Entrophospora sp. SA101]CAJ0745047.1 13767_t:CDS:1 [Entrophospora sp. SA101]CAJ0748062.1 22814_t:CDS:1 [Entrophospora sp. SA101]
MTMILKKNEQHFYQDGDCELKVENILFRVHKNILVLSSAFFSGMFSTAQPSKDELITVGGGSSGNSLSTIVRIDLRDDASDDIEKLLSFLYPNTFFEISWADVANLLRLADKYIVDTLNSGCVSFLKRSYEDEPLKALKLAEIYMIDSVYKESSKLVIDKFEQFFYDGPVLNNNLQGLSRRTQLKLQVQRQQYIEGLNKLFCDTVDRRFPPLATEHLRTKFEECVKDICTFPFQSPSYSWSLLHQVDCSRHFECREELKRLKPFISAKISNYFGCEYETLAWNKSVSKESELHYPFIELRDD